MKKGLFFAVFLLSVWNLKSNAQSWIKCDKGIESDGIRAFASYNGDLFVGGTGLSKDGSSLMRLVNNKWLSEKVSFDNSILTMAVYNNKLFVGGNFDTVDGKPINLIACWDGKEWESLKEKITGGAVRALFVYNNELYIGGAFDSVGGKAVSNVVKWNGNDFETTSNDIKGQVYCFAEYKGSIYAGGQFMAVGNYITRNSVVKWEGNKWIPVKDTSNNRVLYTVNAMEVYDNLLYLGGLFSNNDCLLAWNGSKYDSITNGLKDIYSSQAEKIHIHNPLIAVLTWTTEAFALYTYENNLFVGSSCAVSDGYKYPSCIAKIDSGKWVSVNYNLKCCTDEETTPFEDIKAFIVYNGVLYAGGRFNIGGKLSLIAKFQKE
jgi:hypothetical protein